MIGRMEERCAAPHVARTGGANALVCGQASRTWRRHLGELALTARPDDQGSASPASIGATDAAAVRAMPFCAGHVSWPSSP
jgi:hypothetical protein